MKVERFVNQTRIEGAMPPLFVKNMVIQDKIRKNIGTIGEKNEKYRAVP